MTDMIQTSAAVGEATQDLIRAAAKFAGAAAEQFSAAKPEDYAQLCSAFEKGLAAMVVVVSLNPGDKAVQLCADVGSTRQVLLTVPAREAGERH